MTSKDFATISKITRTGPYKMLYKSISNLESMHWSDVIIHGNPGRWELAAGMQGHYEALNQYWKACK